MRFIRFFPFFLLILYAKTFSTEIEYLYPKPNTDKHSIETPIIVRFAKTVELEKILNDIEINGEISGYHRFNARLSDDKRTVSIKIANRFAPSETVELNILGEKFSFQTTKITPIEQKRIFAEHFVTQYPEIFAGINAAMSEESKSSKDNPLADTIPADFPPVIINSVNNPAPGYIYIANFGMGAERSYLMILDNDGKPVKYRKVSMPGFDFKMQPNGLITNARIITSHIPQGWGWAEAYMEVMDKDLNVIDTVQCQGGYIADFHDFKMLPNGHYLLQSYDPQPVDMSEVIDGGNPNAIVLGVIIQELDADKNVVFQWRSWDHIRITETYAPLEGVALDPVHTNAVELDYDGNILISSRHLSEITKIDRTNGAIIWRLGGLQNMFTFIGEHEENAPTYFSYQHDVRRLPNGNITLYDNGNQHTPPYSRAVEYKLDEYNRKVELVWEYRNDPDIFGETMGSVQRLPNGNTVIGWGGVTGDFFRVVSEVDSNNNITFELSFPKGVSFQTTSYRAFRYPYPPGNPDAVVRKEKISELLNNTMPPLKNDTIHFIENTLNTGVSIYFEQLVDDSLSFIQVEKYPYAPLYPRFHEETPLVSPCKLVNPYKVIIKTGNIQEFNGKIIFDLDMFPQLLHRKGLVVWRRNLDGGEFIPYTFRSSYNEYDNILTLETSELDGEYIFATESPAVTALYKPVLTYPRDNSVLNSESNVTFQWTPEGEFQFCELLISDDPDFTNIIYHRDSIENNIIEVPPFPSDKKYYWKVRANNNNSYSLWSIPFTFEVKAPFISLISPNGGEVWEKGKTYLIQWEHNLDHAFIITLYLNDNPLTNIVDTIYSVYGKYYWEVPVTLSTDTRYKVRVTSYSNNTRFSQSQSSFTITDVNSAEDELTSDVEVFPNPVENHFFIKLRESEELPIRLEVYNPYGKIVANSIFTNATSGLYEMNLDNLSSGIYFLNVVTNKSYYRFKLLKIK